MNKKYNLKKDKRGCIDGLDFIIIGDLEFFLWLIIIIVIIIALFLLFSFANDRLEKSTIGKDLIDYKTDPRNEILNYGSGKINFVVYGGLNSYFSNLSRPIPYSESTKDFINNVMKNKFQYQALLPLVWEIRNNSRFQEDEANLAIKIVQNIPYDYSNSYSSNLIGRYPYEVLYDNKGVSGEKSQLLALLLKELGYGVALFEFNLQDYMAVGILCEDGDYGTNYCFVDSTKQTEVGFIPFEYRNTTPNIIKISEGRVYRE